MDAESAGSIIFPTDFDINKLLKTGNGVQVLFIDSSQVSCHLPAHLNDAQSLFIWNLFLYRTRLALFLKMDQLSSQAHPFKMRLKVVGNPI